MKEYIKMKKLIIKLGDNEIEKQKFHQNKRPISLEHIDINKTVVSHKVLVKVLDIYLYFFQKWVHLEEILMKLNKCNFDKRQWIIRKIYWNLRKKLNIVSKKIDSEPVYNEEYL